MCHARVGSSIRLSKCVKRSIPACSGFQRESFRPMCELTFPCLFSDQSLWNSLISYGCDIQILPEHIGRLVVEIAPSARHIEVSREAPVISLLLHYRFQAGFLACMIIFRSRQRHSTPHPYNYLSNGDRTTRTMYVIQRARGFARVLALYNL